MNIRLIANNCTEPDRAICPRLCIDFCNREETIKAELRDNPVVDPDLGPFFNETCESTQGE